MGNAPPTTTSMEAWIPKYGFCANITALDGNQILAERFDLIALGMQEATWGNKKENASHTGPKSVVQNWNINKDEKISSTTRSVAFNDTSKGVDASSDDDNSHGDTRLENGRVQGEKNLLSSNPRPPRTLRNGAVLSSLMQNSVVQLKVKEDAYLAAIEGADTVALRNMIQATLGDDYVNIVEEQRGQMRQSIWILKDKRPFVENLQISGANTGIGNVLSNKGGIVTSMDFHETRLTFLTAHLAAHEGDTYYKARCENIYDILKSSRTFDLSKKHDIDLALSSHHIFVSGDLNFRTKFNNPNKKIEISSDSSFRKKYEDTIHQQNIRRAMRIIRDKEWGALHSFDELQKGLEAEDFLVNFLTLPCNFHPTFKVNRTEGFSYKDQRCPSYTDRILYKSAPNLLSNIKPLSYEACDGFITSDHKPVRGAFSIVTNDMIQKTTMEGIFSLKFSNIECKLHAADSLGYSDPYVMFIWDNIEMREEGRVRFHLGGKMGKRSKYPSTSFKSKTLDPKWPNEEISLLTCKSEIGVDAMLYICVYDYDFLSDDAILGALPLSIHELVLMNAEESGKEITFDKELERNGKHEGRIKFKLKLSMVVG